jgi:hypothetical protein
LTPTAEFVAYFSEWRHFKILLGTAGCWFLLDIAYAVYFPHLLSVYECS